MSDRQRLGARMAMKRKLASGTVLLVFIVMVCASIVGCASAEVSAYRDQVTELNERWNTAGEKMEVINDKYSEDMESLMKTDPDPTGVASMLRLLSDFTNELQAPLNEMRDIHNKMEAITPPKEFVAQHSQYKLAMIQAITSVESMLNGITEFVNAPNWLYGDILTKRIDKGIETLEDADRNFEEADAVVFPFPWSYVICGLLLLVAVGVAITVFIVRRRRY